MNQELNDFIFKLSLNLNKSVQEIRTTMSFSELLEWINYSKRKSLPTDIQELQMAILISAQMKDSMPLDFMPSISQEVKNKEKQKRLDAKVMQAFSDLEKDS